MRSLHSRLKAIEEYLADFPDPIQIFTFKDGTEREIYISKMWESIEAGEPNDDVLFMVEQARANNPDQQEGGGGGLCYVVEAMNSLNDPEAWKKIWG